VSDANAICRVGTWNVCDATSSKVPLIFDALERRSVDICVLNETKWTFETGDWFIRDEHCQVHRMDFNNQPYSELPTAKRRRGGLALLLNAGLQAQVSLIDYKEGPLNIARWRIFVPNWEHNLLVTGIY
jgi:hypothetical protein